MLFFEDSLHFPSIFVKAHPDRNDKYLARAEPEGPFSAKMLDQDSNKSLDAASHRAVNHNGPCAAWRKRFYLGLLGFSVLFTPLSIHCVDLISFAVRFDLHGYLSGHV